MKTELLKDKFHQRGFEVKNVEFLEEGYEVIISLGVEKGFPCEAKQNIEKDTGLIFAETEYVGNEAKFKLVPVTFEEMVDYIWSYIEVYVPSTRSMKNKLLNSFSALERIVDEISEDCEHKNLAVNNYTNFSKMVF